MPAASVLPPGQGDHVAHEATRREWVETRNLQVFARVDPTKPDRHGGPLRLIDRGIYAAGAWHLTETLVGRSAEALRQEASDIRRWDEFEQELHVFLKGIAAANLKRKHSLGKAILTIYKNLAAWMDLDTRLRPYYEEMKRVYMKRRKKAKREEPKEAAPKE